MIDYFLVGVIAVAAAAAHRAFVLWIYRSWFRQGFAGDAAFHLAVVRAIKRTGGYSGIAEFLIKDEPDTYPILFHRIAALFPLSIVERYSYLPNAIIWSVLTAAAALYAQYVGASLLGISGPSFALTFLVFFLGLASNLSLDMNGLNYVALSERLLSRFACGVYFCAVGLFLAFHDLPSLVVAVLAGVAGLISSMFGRQTIAFVTPPVALISLSVWPLIGMVLSGLGALLVDRSYFLNGIRHMMHFSHAYKNHTKHSRYYQLGFSRFVNLRTVFNVRSGLLQRINELELYEPTKIAFRYPELILMTIFWFVFPDRVAYSEIAVSSAALIVYFATSTTALRHFGEAARYVEYALWILPALALARYAALDVVSPVVWSAYAVWIVVITTKKYRDWGTLEYPKIDRLLAFVAPLNLGPGDTVMTVPFTLGAAIHVRTDCRALMYQGSAVHLGLYQKFMEEVPYLKREWQPLAAAFNVTHVIAEKSHLGIMKSLIGWEYDFSHLRKIAESDAYVAFDVSPASATLAASEVISMR